MHENSEIAQRQGRKRFFFEKKNQKTFSRLSPTTRRQPSKSFLG